MLAGEDSLAEASLVSALDIPVFTGSVSGNSVPVAFGSGCAYSMFDEKCGLVTGNAEGGEIRLSFDGVTHSYHSRPLAPFTIGGKELLPSQCAVKDSIAIRFHSNLPHYSGVLAAKCLADMVFQIDPDLKRANILRSYSPSIDDIALQTQVNTGLPTVRVDVGVESDFVVNTTAAPSLAISWFDVQTMTDSRLRRSQQLAFGVSEMGQLPEKFIVFKRVTIGGVTTLDVLTRVGPEKVPVPNRNHIGMGLLSRFRTTIDFPNRKLYLKPRTGLSPREEPDAGGVRFRVDDTGIFIRDLYLKSPAYLAGLRTGDRVLRFNGKPVEEFTFGQMYELMLREGETVEIVVARSPAGTKGGVGKGQPAASAPSEQKTFRFQTKRWYPWPPVWPADPIVKKPIPLD